MKYDTADNPCVIEREGDSDGAWFSFFQLDIFLGLKREQAMQLQAEQGARYDEMLERILVPLDSLEHYGDGEVTEWLGADDACRALGCTLPEFIEHAECESLLICVGNDGSAVYLVNHDGSVAV